MKKIMLNFGVVFFSVVLGILIIEIAYKLVQKPAESIGGRYYLISGSNGVFKNVADIFTYKENSEITHRVWYETENGFTNEYSYQLRTNNLGLAQNFDVDRGKESLLILGDSFTEGTGSIPWFNSFAKKFPDKTLQLVNGGILGTGFQHWLSLDDYLEELGFKFSKRIIIFISDDASRKQWVFPQGTIQCVEDWRTCEGWETFLGIPPPEEELDFLNKIKTYRANSKYVEGNLKESLKALFPATTDVYRYLVRGVSSKASEDVMRKLLDEYEDNLIFIHIPMKHELNTGYDSDGVKVQAMIRASGGTLYDGMTECGFELGDYYVNDEHFNPEGYGKLSDCVLGIYRDWMSGSTL